MKNLIIIAIAWLLPLVTNAQVKKLTNPTIFTIEQLIAIVETIPDKEINAYFLKHGQQKELYNM